MKTNSVFWASRIWLVPGIFCVFLFFLVPSQVYASGGRLQVEIRIPSVLTVQYAPTIDNGVKVGASRDLQMQRAILIETTETPPGNDQHYVPEKHPNSEKGRYIIIHTL